MNLNQNILFLWAKFDDHWPQDPYNQEIIHSNNDAAADVNGNYIFRTFSPFFYLQKSEET